MTERVKIALEAMAVLAIVTLAGCSTEQVTTACQSTEQVVEDVQRELGIAPIEARLVATAVGIGARVCGSAAYAAVRERVREQVLAYLRQRGAKVD